jgi:hypothetical protein
LAKSADGLEVINASIMKSATACNLTRQKYDELLIAHAAKVGKRLEELLKVPAIGHAYARVAHANGYPL